MDHQKLPATYLQDFLRQDRGLLEVINKCEGLPNKELAKFADQINALCDKWSR